jgi:hypothetical protein
MVNNLFVIANFFPKTKKEKKKKKVKKKIFLELFNYQNSE